MRSLLPRFLAKVAKHFKPEETPGCLPLVDLGCGTGRNTLQMLQAATETSFASQVQTLGLDASPGMIEVARTAIQSATEKSKAESSPEVTLDMLDLLQPLSKTQLPAPLQTSGAVGVISTLVIEHIPLRDFFAAAATMMRPGSYLLLTNMHPDMGAISQAGFTDPQSGVKIRPTSYCHSIPEVLSEAAKSGLVVEDLVGAQDIYGVLERRVEDYPAEALGERAKKWAGIKVWFGVCFRKELN